MSDYAIMDGNTVINVIIADDADTVAVVLPDADFIAVTEQTGPAYIGGDYTGERFRPPAPFPSWEWAGESWQPPVPYPSDGADYVWDEQQTDWIEYVAPEPAAEE